MFARIGPIAHIRSGFKPKSSQGGVKVVRAKNIKEKNRYMRIKRLKRSNGRQQSKIAPAAWQEFIEI